MEGYSSFLQTLVKDKLMKYSSPPDEQKFIRRGECVSVCLGERGKKEREIERERETERETWCVHVLSPFSWILHVNWSELLLHPPPGKSS